MLLCPFLRTRPLHRAGAPIRASAKAESVPDAFPRRCGCYFLAVRSAGREMVAEGPGPNRYGQVFAIVRSCPMAGRPDFRRRLRDGLLRQQLQGRRGLACSRTGRFSSPAEAAATTTLPLRLSRERQARPILLPRRARRGRPGREHGNTALRSRSSATAGSSPRRIERGSGRALADPPPAPDQGARTQLRTGGRRLTGPVASGGHAKAALGCPTAAFSWPDSASRNAIGSARTGPGPLHVHGKA